MRAGRPRRDRDAQPARVGHRVLGGAGDRRGRRAAQRVVDRPGARVRTRRFGHRSCCSPTTSAPNASRRTSARRACGRPCSSVPTRELPGGVPWADVVDGDDPPLPDARDRSRRRRRDHVHVRHDRHAEGRGADAAQLHNFLMQGVYLTMQLAAQAGHLDRQPRHRCRWRRCSRSRCSTSAGCSRSCCPTPRPAARSCSMYRWDAGEAVEIVEREAITDGRRRADDDVRAARGGQGEGCDARVAQRHLVGRDARAARTRAPHRRTDVVARRARQWLRPDRDVGRGDRQLRPGVRRQSGERRQADLAGHRRAHRRPATAPRRRSARSARSG